MKSIEDRIGYKFNNAKLLSKALNHSSIRKNAMSFERLEFLGDRVLGLVIAEYVYNTCSADEGEMAKMQAAFVCRKTCSDVAMSVGIDMTLQTAGSHLKNNQTVLADAMEAVIGAIFLDSGYDDVKDIILNLWQKHIHGYDETMQDPKTKLQEVSQKKSGFLPVYELLNVSGEAHNPTYRIAVSACGKTVESTGHSRKCAETEGARMLLQEIHNQI